MRIQVTLILRTLFVCLTGRKLLTGCHTIHERVSLSALTFLHIQTVTNAGSSWGISSIFGGHDNRTATRENSTSKPFSEPVQTIEQGTSMIHLREVYPHQLHIQGCSFPSMPSNLLLYYFYKPPSVLRPLETHSEQEAVEIVITKLLLRSYYDIVRKNIEDSVPKAIMHFLVILFLSPEVFVQFVSFYFL